MPRAGLTPDVVVTSAGDLADDVGYEQLSLAAVADRLGVRVPSLYKHVAGLDGLRRQLALAGLLDLARVLGDAVEGRTGRSGLCAVARAYRAYVHAHPGRYAATVRAPASDDAEAQAAARTSVDVMLGVAAGYGLRGEAAVHAVRGIRAALHGFVSLEQSGGFGLPYDLDLTFDRLLDVLDAGLAAAAGTG